MPACRVAPLCGSGIGGMLRQGQRAAVQACSRRNPGHFNHYRLDQKSNLPPLPETATAQGPSQVASLCCWSFWADRGFVRVAVDQLSLWRACCADTARWECSSRRKFAGKRPALPSSCPVSSHRCWRDFGCGAAACAHCPSRCRCRRHRRCLPRPFAPSELLALSLTCQAASKRTLKEYFLQWRQRCPPMW